MGLVAPIVHSFQPLLYLDLKVSPVSHRIKEMIRTIPNYPKPGIMFRDISTLLLNRDGINLVTHELARAVSGRKFDKIVGIESRGFIVGSPLAFKLGCGLVLARKKGKLPGRVKSIEYELEYGRDCIEIHDDAIEPNDRCLVVDDLIATGGTASATCDLIKSFGGHVAGCAFIVNLPELGGAKKLESYGVTSLVQFDGH